MSKINEITIALLIGYLIGVVVGDYSTSKSSQKEIIELKIELTKLEINKLKGECND